MVRPSDGFTRMKPGRPPRWFMPRWEGYCEDSSVEATYVDPKKTMSDSVINAIASPESLPPSGRYCSSSTTTGDAEEHGMRSRKVIYFGQFL